MVTVFPGVPVTAAPPGPVVTLDDTLQSAWAAPPTPATIAAAAMEIVILFMMLLAAAGPGADAPEPSCVTAQLPRFPSLR